MGATLESLGGWPAVLGPLTAGSDLWHTPGVERLGIPALKVTDGPNGARGSRWGAGGSMCFPCGTALGKTLSEAYERALSEAGVPYVLRGGERFFDRPEIREAVLLLRGAARSAESGEKLADNVRDVLSGLGWSASAPSSLWR